MLSLLQYFYLYVLTVPVFFLVDMVWIAGIAKNFYNHHIGYLLGPINWPAAVIFYLLYIVGILFFAVAPALAQGSLLRALILGALFGFFTYATYDFTNLTTVKDWPLIVTVIDTFWGVVLSSSVAIVSFIIARSLFL